MNATMAHEWCWSAEYDTMAAFVDISIYTHDESVSSYNDIHLHLKECRARQVGNDMEIDLWWQFLCEREKYCVENDNCSR